MTKESSMRWQETQPNPTKEQRIKRVWGSGLDDPNPEWVYHYHYLVCLVLVGFGFGFDLIMRVIKRRVEWIVIMEWK